MGKIIEFKKISRHLKHFSVSIKIAAQNRRIMALQVALTTHIRKIIMIKSRIISK